MRADARHLRHHDDGRPCAGHVNDLADAIERDVATRKILERIVLFHGPFRHRRNSSGAAFMDIVAISVFWASVKIDIYRGFFDMTKVAVLEIERCMASS